MAKLLLPARSSRPTPAEAARRGGRRTAIDGALALIAVLLIVQMWLLTAALEALLAGHRETALPAAVTSALLFAACAGLYLFIEGVDASERPTHAESQASEHPRT